MIIVTVHLASAVDHSITQLAMMDIDNISGGGTKRDYRARTYRGRNTETLARRVVQREGKVLGHPSEAVHVWNLVAKALAGMGYGDAEIRATGKPPELMFTPEAVDPPAASS